MKFVNTVFMAWVVLLVSSCTKIEVLKPEFDISTEKTTYKVGEELTFRFSGNPDIITFYSGEPLTEYEFSNGRILKTDSLYASFSSRFIWFTQPDQMSVLMSTDFNGKYTIDDILAANWSDDKTKDFTLASTHNIKVASGTKDVSPVGKDQKAFFAFRFNKKPNTESGKGRFWYIDQLSMQTKTVLGRTTLFNGSKFTLVYDKNYTHDSLKLCSVSSAGVIAMANPVELDPYDTQIWAVSPAISLADLDMGPDKGTAVKGYRDPMPADFKYEYSKPGVYMATFTGSNNNTYGTSEKVVRQVQITIVD